MTEHTESQSSSGADNQLASLKMAQLQSLASQLGIKGISRMRKAQLVQAISDHQRGATVADRDAAQAEEAKKKSAPEKSSSSREDAEKGSEKSKNQGAKRRSQKKSDEQRHETTGKNNSDSGDGAKNNDSSHEESKNDGDKSGNDRRDNDQRRNRRNRNQRNDKRDSDKRDGNENSEDSEKDSSQDNEQRGNNRHRRNRDRQDRNRRNRRGQDDQQRDDNDQVSEDDVLVPVAGILDVLDNYAFVRTSGWLPSPNDVYVSMAMVKKYGMRKGDAIVGAVKAPGSEDNNNGGQHNNRHNNRGGNRGRKPNRGKFNALVRVDSINSEPAVEHPNRVEFSKLVPLYPNERLRLESDSKNIGTRIVDLVAPIGKGQRGLIVSPPKAGKTMMLQSIANAITTNNPEVSLMMVLVDERPEEVTDMQRSVRGQVIASTFDRPAEDHTTVAELAIERAKRLVEKGHDVVVLLDSMTRLGRAYNLSAPQSGRILSGGVDSAALYPPKKFFGAARNIENGGSLTILATALVETGSRMDEVIFEEFKGTGNMELRLSRELSERRIFPAVDVNASGTRREEALLSQEEIRIMWKLRRVLSGLETQQALELLTSKLKDTQSNAEFLMLVSKTTLGSKSDS